jgi:hypothetical protein
MCDPASGVPLQTALNEINDLTPSVDQEVGGSTPPAVPTNISISIVVIVTVMAKTSSVFGSL